MHCTFSLTILECYTFPWRDPIKQPLAVGVSSSRKRKQRARLECSSRTPSRGRLCGHRALFSCVRVQDVKRCATKLDTATKRTRSQLELIVLPFTCQSDVC